MTKILVVIDPTEEVHSGLERCKEISPNADVELEVCLFIENDSAKNLANSLREKREWLEAQVKPYTAIGYKMTSEVRTFSRLYEAIIEAAVNGEVDLVFKPMRQHSLVRRVVVTSTDWNLIRFCPMPVLLVNGSQNVHGRPVVAAIDAVSDDDQHAELNDIVLQQAQRVAGVIDGQVACANAWSIHPAVMAAGANDAVPLDIARDKHADHLKHATQLANQYNIPGDMVFVEEGSPQFVVNETVKKVDAGVVVIGTVARSGVSGLFIGNTAEFLVEETTTDMLVVKAPDFECPL